MSQRPEETPSLKTERDSCPFVRISVRDRLDWSLRGGGTKTRSSILLGLAEHSGEGPD